MAGTPEKMLEHLLETQMDKTDDISDSFLEDFLLTHVIFMPSNHLCPTLMAQYPLFLLMLLIITICFLYNIKVMSHC